MRGAVVQRALLLEGVAPEPHESVERMRSFMAELAEKRG